MILASLLALALHMPPTESFFPANTLTISPVAESGLSQAQFEADIASFTAAWKPVALHHGKILIIDNLWSNSTINSDTVEIGPFWKINAYGGLARYPGMTSDAYLLVLCHELGHHLGGAPVYSDQHWASVEGEADYYATMKCMKPWMGAKAVQRVQDASLVLAGILADLGGDAKPSASQHDPSEVEQTYEAHPRAQCRLDTYIAGIICNATGPFSRTDPHVGACNEGAGSRPRCWYKP